MKSLFLSIMLGCFFLVTQNPTKKLIVTYYHYVDLYNDESKIYSVMSDLKIQGNTSLYIIHDEKEDGVVKNLEDETNLKVSYNYYTNAIFYKNIETKELISKEKLMSKTFIVEDHLLEIKWEIKDEKKTIATYECQKAIGEFRGRVYTAWFTLDIPVSTGPWKLWGLPGLILEAYDADKEVQFLFKSLKIDTDTASLMPPTGKNTISWDEYTQLAIRKLKAFVKFLGSNTSEGESIKISNLNFNAIEKSMFENEK